jgi:hypothetical protein
VPNMMITNASNLTIAAGAPCAGGVAAGFAA